MPIFSRKVKTKSSDAIVLTQEDDVLGYLDEIYRKRISLSLAIKNKTLSTDILFIDKKNKLLRIQVGPSGLGSGPVDVRAGFSLDRTWWSFQTRLVMAQDKPHLLIPKFIKHHERRKTPRTAFTAREQVKVTVMEGLGSGHGVFGMATDISPDGVCISIEKAMVLSNEKEITPSPNLFKPGARLVFVKLNRIPGCQVIEAQGIAKRVYRDGKWRLALELDKLTKAQRGVILRFIEPRVLEFKFIKRSLKKREERNENLSSPQTRGPATRTPPPNAAEKVPNSAPTASIRNAEATKKPVAPPQDTGPKTKVLVMGSELFEQLPFLKEEDSPFEVIVGTSPVELVKVLSVEKPRIMLCGTEFKGRNASEILERIANMGIEGKRKTFICSQGEVLLKDRIKFKMLQINEFITLPIRNKQTIINRLKNA